MNISVLEFTAEWCVPCKRYDLVLPDVEKELGITIDKRDTATYSDLTTKYAINTLPTLLVLKDGEPIGKVEGAFTTAALVISKIREIIVHADEDNIVSYPAACRLTEEGFVICDVE